jgi:hypothetical protein
MLIWAKFNQKRFSPSIKKQNFKFFLPLFPHRLTSFIRHAEINIFGTNLQVHLNYRGHVVYALFDKLILVRLWRIYPASSDGWYSLIIDKRISSGLPRRSLLNLHISVSEVD